MLSVADISYVSAIQKNNDLLFLLGCFMTSKDYFAKEIDIDLQKYWLVLKRRWFLPVAVCGLATGLALVAFNAKKPTYRAKAEILFKSSNQALFGVEDSSREIKSLTSRDNPLDTQVVVFRSIPVVQKVIDRLDIKSTTTGEPIKPDEILTDLTIEGIPGTDVLEVAYQSPDPKLSAMIVNTIVDVYIQNDMQVNRAAAASAQEFISGQLPDSEDQVSAAESKLLEFKERNGIVDLSEESKNTVTELSQLNNSLTQLKSDIANSAAQATKIQQNLKLTPQEAYLVGLVSESPGVQEVLVQLQSVQADLALARTQYEEVHPKVENIRSQEEALLNLLQQRINIALGDDRLNLPLSDLQSGELEQALISEFLRLDTEKSGLQQRENQLLDAQSSQQKRAKVLPGLEKQQRELERKLDAAQTTYELLLDNLQQARVLENQNVGNARIVSSASVPIEPVAPSLKRYLLVGGFAGLVLGAMIAFLADLIDRSVKSVQEGQELYEYPLLGVIPAWKKLKPSRFSEFPSVLVRGAQQVPIVEAYQALQANLKFSSLDKPLKVIAVTSAVAGEGKSEVTANLALTLAHLGHLVLVVDADMRQSTQQHVWDVSKVRGLSNFVAGQIVLKDVIIQKEPNLHFLPAGVTPPNPLAILESQQMASLLQACEKAYDYVIIDTPPILGLADTITLGRMTDGLLLVMQPGMADVDSIRATKAQLAQSQQKVLGVVANAIDVRSQPDRHFYHNQEYAIKQNEGSILGIAQGSPESVESNGRV